MNNTDLGGYAASMYHRAVGQLDGVFTVGRIHLQQQFPKDYWDGTV